MSNQSTSHIFMIEPESFSNNIQTESSNHYQVKEISENKDVIANKALEEFFNLKNAIERHGVKVTVMKGSSDCPDHIFPNWFITFADKTMQIFSMMAPNRRIEKKPEMISHLTKSYDLVDDMSYLEKDNIFLESTSSMVFDRVNNIVYAGLSDRTNKHQLQSWCSANKFELIMFETKSHLGLPIYHTDVLMYVGTNIIGICFEVIKSEYRELVKQKVSQNHEILELSSQQILDFCGNAIEVQNKDSELFLVMSTRAFKALQQKQLDALLLHYKNIIHSDIPTIEKYGGGSARCMITELF